MLYKSNKLYIVKLAKVKQKNGDLISFDYKDKYYAAYLMKVGKNCCIYKILDKDMLVLDNVNLVNTVGEYYIYHKESINYSTRLFNKKFYSQDEIKKSEEKINKDREFERDI